MLSSGPRWAATVGLYALLASRLLAVDLTGTWIGTIAKKGRTPAKDVAFRLVQNGSALGGKAYNDNGSSDAIVSGQVSDGKILFEVEAREQAGNQVNIVVYKFQGTVAGKQIAVTRERASARDAASGSDIPVRRPGDTDEQDRERRLRAFKLERLFR